MPDYLSDDGLEKTLKNDVKIQEIPVKITKMERVTDTIMILNLIIPKTKQFHYQAGQYIDIILRDGKKRSFSLANHPHSNNQALELHIRYIEYMIYIAYW